MTHRLTNTRLYSIFRNMKQRCYNPNNPKYNSYGGRGITICDEWLNDFQMFYDWSMSHGYSDELTIDRINNDKGYSPQNCRWITWEENRKNSNHGRRKSENPKSIPIQVRLDMECKDILKQYCKQEEISEAEGIRKGIKKLLKELKSGR